jgi:hypothetical protein
MAKRWPKEPTKRLLFFKAEEYQMNIMWCSHFTMYYIGITNYNDKIIKIGLVLVNIGRLYYIYTRLHGWNIETLQNAKELLGHGRD